MGSVQQGAGDWVWGAAVVPTQYYPEGSSATRRPLLSNTEALNGAIVIIIALKQSTESLLLWRDH